MLAPAYNEEATVVAERARTVDAQVPDLEVVLINDGSTTPP
jgi:cellulose synthase/poly-beta-1,6-N-acetylglucosamine synthase-like glycosyltransferase